MITETLTVRIPPEDKAALKAFCKRDDLTAGQLVRRLVREWVAAQQQAAPEQQNRKA